MVSSPAFPSATRGRVMSCCFSSATSALALVVGVGVCVEVNLIRSRFSVPRNLIRFAWTAALVFITYFVGVYPFTLLYLSLSSVLYRRYSGVILLQLLACKIFCDFFHCQGISAFLVKPTSELFMSRNQHRLEGKFCWRESSLVRQAGLAIPA